MTSTKFQKVTQKVKMSYININEKYTKHTMYTKHKTHKLCHTENIHRTNNLHNNKKSNTKE